MQTHVRATRTIRKLPDLPRAILGVRAGDAALVRPHDVRRLRAQVAARDAPVPAVPCRLYAWRFGEESDPLIESKKSPL